VVNPYKSHHRYYHQRPRRLIANGGYAKRWSHQPVHRKGVAYRSKHTGKKYYSSRVKPNKTRKSSQYSHRQLKQSLSVKNHSFSKKESKKVSKKETKISQIRNKESLRRSPKPYSAHTQFKDVGQNKHHSHNNRVKKSTPKRHKENVSKQRSSKAVKNNSHSSRKLHRQNASFKTHHSNNKKARH